MTVEGTKLKEMVTRCLDDDPNQRPTIQQVVHMIISVKVMTIISRTQTNIYTVYVLSIVM